jgi:hypothetical protein
VQRPDDRYVFDKTDIFQCLRIQCLYAGNKGYSSPLGHLRGFVQRYEMRAVRCVFIVHSLIFLTFQFVQLGAG